DSTCLFASLQPPASSGSGIGFTSWEMAMQKLTFVAIQQINGGLTLAQWLLEFTVSQGTQPPTRADIGSVD
ncbi:hypothetical protein, partial [Ramlibacter sp.]